MRRSAHKDKSQASIEVETGHVAPDPAPLYIVGAGAYLKDIITLVQCCSEFRLVGILDPSPELKGQEINNFPVIGWLADIKEKQFCAVIGTPASPGLFDRQAVFYILAKRGAGLPVIKSPHSRIGRNVQIHRGTVVLDKAVLLEDSCVGPNCIIGPSALVETGIELEPHTILSTGERCMRNDSGKKAPAKPKSLAATIAKESDSIQEIIHRLNWASMEIVLITDQDGTLSGTITDGDIRRGILAGVDTSQAVSTIMNRKPVSVPIGTSHQEMLHTMQANSISHLPVVDNKNHPVRLESIQTTLDALQTQNAVVMAGGLGARLRPLTEKTPKPLLPVGGRPILEHILSGLHESGVNDVVLSVNYLAQNIQNHVGDGSQYDLNVNYLSEKERLGTAGALSLLEKKPRQPFLVMNGDLLTDMNFAKLLRFQNKHKYDIVMCVKKYQFQIPYGVVNLQDQTVTSLSEKPSYEHFINAGIYAVQPRCISMIPKNTFFDMTDLIKTVIDNGGLVGAFPIIEYWRDIGTPQDLDQAAAENKMGTNT